MKDANFRNEGEKLESQDKHGVRVGDHCRSSNLEKMDRILTDFSH